MTRYVWVVLSMFLAACSGAETRKDTPVGTRVPVKYAQNQNWENPDTVSGNPKSENYSIIGGTTTAPIGGATVVQDSVKAGPKGTVIVAQAPASDPTPAAPVFERAQSLVVDASKAPSTEESGAGHILAPRTCVVVDRVYRAGKVYVRMFAKDGGLKELDLARGIFYCLDPDRIGAPGNTRAKPASYTDQEVLVPVDVDAARRYRQVAFNFQADNKYWLWIPHPHVEVGDGVEMVMMQGGACFVLTDYLVADQATYVRSVSVRDKSGRACGELPPTFVVQPTAPVPAATSASKPEATPPAAPVAKAPAPATSAPVVAHKLAAAAPAKKAEPPCDPCEELKKIDEKATEIKKDTGAIRQSVGDVDPQDPPELKTVQQKTRDTNKRVREVEKAVGKAKDGKTSLHKKVGEATSRKKTSLMELAEGNSVKLNALIWKAGLRCKYDQTAPCATCHETEQWYKPFSSQNPPKANGTAAPAPKNGTGNPAPPTPSRLWMKAH